MAGEPASFLDRESAVRAIETLGEDDLRFVNRLVIQRLKLLAQARRTVAMASFHIDQRVRFRSPDGEELSGCVVRINQKTVTVDTDDGEQWRVAPTLLTPE